MVLVELLVLPGLTPQAADNRDLVKGVRLAVTAFENQLQRAGPANWNEKLPHPLKQLIALGNFVERLVCRIGRLHVLDDDTLRLGRL